MRKFEHAIMTIHHEITSVILSFYSRVRPDDKGLSIYRFPLETSVEVSALLFPFLVGRSLVAAALRPGHDKARQVR